ncbi:MAG TPA: hypothetical protein VFV66_31695 [Nonomuraea sp.]|nr:hypothetical protein [Nonomuraea sp.]
MYKNMFKGEGATTYTVASNLHTPACGYPFEKGARYLVFATREDGMLTEPVPGVRLTSHLCSGNVPLDRGTGPLRPGDERAAGHETLADRVDPALVAALGAPSPVRATAGSAGAPATPTAADPPAAAPAAAGAAEGAAASDAAWAFAGLAVVALVLVSGVLVLRRRARTSGSAHEG